jgi:hypothetical protein
MSISKFYNLFNVVKPIFMLHLFPFYTQHNPLIPNDPRVPPAARRNMNATWRLQPPPARKPPGVVLGRAVWWGGGASRDYRQKARLRGKRAVRTP